ncbi:hypothetical protein JOM56_008984 [Amanita muscaria]
MVASTLDRPRLPPLIIHWAFPISRQPTLYITWTTPHPRKRNTFTVAVWRRSCPGTIVCNKCGPYECIHLGPLRFNVLCTGNEARKQRELHDSGPSSASAKSSSSGWDGNISVYSSGSGLTTVA